ncbi:sigma-70 family RNA polymerase sigma factor [Paenibacillus sp. EKM206P]|uniref:sigma-70 family RNA polymerase sigma factor n=1 Tax=Paenibacillus sp. EKM206P TaxID=1683674 RepID=UPI0013EAA87B|nr:sigma-70 family RNA polymerase sigma factor [Paenibacillus sp. EKM206P]KAF6569064.1 sigma-70 family RNA polymerase sigma factor [Paenibacillus sp. EKM206P]
MSSLKIRDFNPHLGAKEDFIRDGLRQVKKIAQRYKPLCIAKGIDLEDLISEGTIGLMLAFDRFDPGDREVKFEAYAFPYIKGHMLQFVQKSGIIRLPNKPGRLVYQLFDKGLESADSSAVAEALHISQSTAHNVLQYSKFSRVHSLSQPVGLEEDTELINFIPTHDDDTVLQIEEFITLLDSTEKRVIELLIGGFKIYEISRRLSISQEKLFEKIDILQDKARRYFGGGLAVQNDRFNVTKQQYMNLRSKGLTDASIAERFGMGHTALYRRKARWGLVESRSGKTSSPNSISNPDNIVQEDNSNKDDQIHFLNGRISKLEAENKLLWEMVNLYREPV